MLSNRMVRRRLRKSPAAVGHFPGLVKAGIERPSVCLMVTMLLAFAEFERDMIVERTSTGKAVAKANNPEWREGRRKKEVDMGALSVLREMQRDGRISVDGCCQQLGISRGTWYNLLRMGA